MNPNMRADCLDAVIRSAALRTWINETADEVRNHYTESIDSHEQAWANAADAFGISIGTLAVLSGLDTEKVYEAFDYAQRRTVELGHELGLENTSEGWLTVREFFRIRVIHHMIEGRA